VGRDRIRGHDAPSFLVTRATHQSTTWPRNVRPQDHANRPEVPALRRGREAQNGAPKRADFADRNLVL